MLTREEIEQRINDMHTLKESLIKEFEAIKMLREIQGDTLPQQQRALAQIQEYHDRWKSLAIGTYVPQAN